VSGWKRTNTSRENDANRNSRTCIAACSARRDDCRCDILAGTHDQWATVTARISRPDRNRGMTPSCSSGVFSGTTFAHRQRRARVGADARRGDAADGDRLQRSSLPRARATTPGAGGGQEKWPLERRRYCAGPIVFENAGLNFLLSEKLRREIFRAVMAIAEDERIRGTRFPALATSWPLPPCLLANNELGPG
jgi:hypothetical protein